MRELSSVLEKAGKNKNERALQMFSEKVNAFNSLLGLKDTYGEFGIEIYTGHL